MRIIKPSTLTQWAKQHSNAAPALLHWYEIAREAKWQTLTDIRSDLPHADVVKVESKKPVTIFNIAGNNFRLITAIHFNTGRVFLLDFITHADYSKDTWKNRL
jgi:mRNA interferase HigB